MIFPGNQYIEYSFFFLYIFYHIFQVNPPEKNPSYYATTKSHDETFQVKRQQICNIKIILNLYTQQLLYSLARNTHTHKIKDFLQPLLL